MVNFVEKNRVIKPENRRFVNEYYEGGMKNKRAFSLVAKDMYLNEDSGLLHAAGTTRVLFHAGNFCPETGSGYQGCATFRAEGVLPFNAGEIAGVNIVQPCGQTDISGSFQGG